MESIDLIKLQEDVFVWFLEKVWTMDTLIQSSAIIVSFFISALLYRSIKSKTINTINKIETSYLAKRIMHNLRRLIVSFLMLFLLFLFEIFAIMLKAGIDFSLIDAAMSLLAAWIIVRLAVQFVENSFIRNLFAFSIWAIAAFSILGVLDETVSTLDSLGMNLGTFRLSALTIVKGLFALFVLLYTATFVSALLERRIRQISGLTLTSKVLIGKVTRITLITLALLVGITTAGVDLSLLAVFSGAVGLGIGFGLQKVISNLFSGLLLLLDKSIEPGDVIELPNGAFGWVEHMGARYTEIVTRDNKSFLIPNEDFVTQQVVNWSHENTLIRLEMKFGVDYQHNPHEIKEIAERAAAKPERVVEDPRPVCHLVEFGDNALIFSLRFWIKDAEKGITNMKGAVMLELWDAFVENGIKIPYPQREISIKEQKDAA
jgi:small-conductance mechanosensitive channel